VVLKEHYLKGTDMKTVAGQVNKPIKSIKKYYKEFTSTPELSLKTNTAKKRK